MIKSIDKKEDDNKYKELIQQIDQIVTSNLGNTEFDVDQLTSALNIGTSKLYAVIKKEYNDTPGKYLLKRRLDAALVLLKDYRLNTTQVAHKAGFSDATYFTTSFKARFGKTPGEVQNEKLYN